MEQMHFFRPCCDRNLLPAKVPLNTRQFGDDLIRAVGFGKIEQSHFTQRFGEINLAAQHRVAIRQIEIFGPDADVYLLALVLGPGRDRGNR